MMIMAMIKMMVMMKMMTATTVATVMTKNYPGDDDDKVRSTFSTVLRQTGRRTKTQEGSGGWRWLRGRQVGGGGWCIVVFGRIGGVGVEGQG